ncbi:MAG: response regulator [Dorea sp.]|nr:response regulator [Dorea sp.]MCI9227938.1 response regulator [Dorea sp.]
MQKRILVVDDDSMNLVRTKMILGKQYDVILSESGEDALKKLKNETIDLVLLDIEMPNMNGIETFERMKDLPAEVPVIFLTASGDEEDVMSAIRLGAVNYLKKPFYPEELLKRVAKEIEKE